MNNKILAAALIALCLVAGLFAYRHIQKQAREQQLREEAIKRTMDTGADPKAADPRRPSDKGPYGKHKTRAYDQSKKALERSVHSIEKNDAEDNP